MICLDYGTLWGLAAVIDMHSVLQRQLFSHKHVFQTYSSCICIPQMLWSIILRKFMWRLARQLNISSGRADHISDVVAYVNSLKITGLQVTIRNEKSLLDTLFCTIPSSRESIGKAPVAEFLIKYWTIHIEILHDLQSCHIRFWTHVVQAVDKISPICDSSYFN